MLLIPAWPVTRLAPLYLISFSPGRGSHGLSTHGCCSCEPPRFQQLPKYRVYFSGSILEKNLVLEWGKEGEP